MTDDIKNNGISGQSQFITNRRQWLKGVGGLAAGALASGLLPANVRRALANPLQQRGTLKDVKHLVLIMQENRSFDHYFGTLSGVRGFDDPNAMTLSTGKSVFYQPDEKNPDGYLLPFHLNTKTTSAQKIPSTNHSWWGQRSCWNHGTMDRWVKEHRKRDGKNGPYCMGYYTREDIPFQYALADAFTICDNYFCSLFGPTSPNRMYWMTGTIDPQGKYGGPMTNNGYPKDGFRWTTYAERLQKAGISWKVYQQKNNFGDNNLEMFHNFMKASKNSPLYQRGMIREPKGKFEHDAYNDNLPAVSWVVSPDYQSEHPSYMPADGAAYVASKLDAIAANPEVWAKTAVVLNFDENDGLFDHVSPPTPPKGTPDEFVKGQPIGAGFRVPCIIISPWTAGGWVCSEPFDHTSVLQLLEKFTGVREPNISQWRRKTFGDLTSTFRFDGASSKIPALPETLNTLNRARYDAKHLPRPLLPQSKQTMPTQEPGTRKQISWK